MLEGDDLTLAKAINKSHLMEATTAQLQIMTTCIETDSVTVHELHNECKFEVVSSSRVMSCRNSGSKHHPRRCPACSKTC